MNILSIKNLLLAATIVGATLAVVNNSWLIIFTSVSRFSAPLLINPISATMASLVPMLAASIAYFFLQRFAPRGPMAYKIGTLVLGLLSTWSSFAQPMPDGSPTPVNFTILSLPMHITAIVGALMIPRLGARLSKVRE